MAETEQALEELVDDEFTIPFRVTLTIAGTAGSGARLRSYFHENGKIIHVMMHFPRGCNSLVRARILKDERNFYPSREYFALDNATPEWYPDVNYRARELLTFEALNGDGANPHTVSGSVTIKYKRSKLGVRYG